MPKKAPKNAFFFYMQSFREEQKKKGIIYENTAKVAEAAGPSWKDAPPSVRSKFEEMSKQAKQKFNQPLEKYTSEGVPLSHIANYEREKEQAEENEREDIMNLIKLRALDGSLLEEDFYLMDVNCYCKTNVGYIIGEITLLRFNIQDGVKDTYHEVINPGQIPMGYTFDVKLGSKEFGLEMPDETSRSNHIQTLANTIDYLKQKDRNLRVLPPIYTVQEKVQPVMDFIIQMCFQAGEDETLFRVYKLDTLFFNLANVLKKHSDEGFPKETLATQLLKKDPFKYSPGIGCEHHEESDKSTECTLSRARRWAYSVLDYCCGLAAVSLLPGHHVPHDYDLHRIHLYQEQKKGRMTPSVAGRAPSSCNTSIMNESVADASFSSRTSTASKKESRVHVPLRMPKTDYSGMIQRAPELTEDDFPSLPLRAGRGKSPVLVLDSVSWIPDGRGMGSFTRK